MTDTSRQSDDQLLARIRQETETIAFADLAIFFAKGKVISVDPQLDLVDVAFQMSKNNSGLISDLMQRRLVMGIADDTAKEWFDSKVVVRASVVSPWVLVQRVSPIGRRNPNPTPSC